MTVELLGFENLNCFFNTVEFNKLVVVIGSPLLSATGGIVSFLKTVGRTSGAASFPGLKTGARKIGAGGFRGLLSWSSAAKLGLCKKSCNFNLAGEMMPETDLGIICMSTAAMKFALLCRFFGRNKL